MNSTKILTYLLYALIAGLLLVVVYKACQAKNRQAALSQEARALDQKRHLGYTDPDSLGTIYEGDTSTVIVDANTGVEEENLTAPSAGASKPAVPLPPPQEKSVPAEPSAPPATAPMDLDDDGRDGRYRVVAGSFTKLEGARREMQRLIKMGYVDAEIGYYNRGKYAVVVVKRTDNLNEANRIVDDLERRGIDAAVIDRIRKK